MAAVAVNPTSPIAKDDACMISCSAVDSNDDSAFDADLYPASPALVYYFKASKSGEDDLISHLFTPNGGAHVWMDVIFPVAGTWAVGLFNYVGDGQVVSSNVTVQ
jgi:hypothetical protein